MKYFAILDLNDSGDGYAVYFFENKEDAFEFISNYDCLSWVTVEVEKGDVPLTTPAR